MKDLLFKIVDGRDDSTTELSFSPDGWDDTIFQITRQKTYYALFRTYSVNLSFVKDGAYILRDIFYNGSGVSSEAFLEVHKLDRVGNEYKLIYTGKLQFNTFKDSETKVSITAADYGIVSMIKQNGDNEYEVYIAPGTWTVTYLGATFEIKTIMSLFYALLDKISNSGYTADTIRVDYTTIPDINDVVFITNGKEIRTGSGASYLKTSFNALAQTIYALSGYMIDIELDEDSIETIKFKSYNDIYDSATAIAIGAISNLSVYPSERIISKLKIGFENQDYGDDTYNYEFIGLTEWNTNIPNYKNEIEILSKYRADFLGIDKIIADTTIDDSDEDIFLICATEKIPTDYEREIGYIKKAGGLPHAAGNCRISPARMLITHLDYISALVDKTTGILEFITSFGQNSMHETSYLSEAYVKEYESPSLKTQTLFRPFTIEFDAAVDADFIADISANLNQAIEFTYRGNTYKGFLEETKVKLYGKTQVHMKLLSAYDNDLTLLVR